MLDYLMVRKADRCLVKDVKVRLKQGSVLSPLMFSVVSSDARSGIPSELLYASYLVLMASTFEQHGRRVAEWRVMLIEK